MNDPRQTRSTRQPTHLLQTPDTFVRTPLPGLTGGLAIVHACPALGAAFLQYTAELDAQGTLAPTPHQRFLYVLSGHSTLALADENQTHALRSGSFAYLRPAEPASLTALTPTRIVVLEKAYEPLPSITPPRNFASDEDTVPWTSLNDAGTLQVRTLLPPDLRFDFAVNIMLYAPAAQLPQVEIHYMEHGLLMLEGSGPYRLGDGTYPAQAGDFIWMAPFCPQFFQADPSGPAKYLIYKDTNRVPTL